RNYRACARTSGRDRLGTLSTYFALGRAAHERRSRGSAGAADGDPEHIHGFNDAKARVAASRAKLTMARTHSRIRPEGAYRNRLGCGTLRSRGDGAAGNRIDTGFPW